MKKINITAHQQFLTLIETLKSECKTLNYNEFISTLNAIKTISTTQHLIEILIQSLKSLHHSNNDSIDILTQREKEVMLLIGRGLANTEIAAQLNLSKSTVETHRKNIRKKLKLKGNDKLVTFALVFSVQQQLKL